MTSHALIAERDLDASLPGDLRQNVVEWYIFDV
jgi:hypothetical protein